MNFRSLFHDKKKQEIEELRTQLKTERVKNLHDIRKIGEKFRLIITSGEVELVVKNINEVREEK